MNGVDCALVYEALSVGIVRTGKKRKRSIGNWLGVVAEA
jgi:hypothetical protein